MDNEQRLEQYLQKLDKALKKIPVSEKAEIITEIRSHIIDAQDRGDQSLKDILNSLGEPEQVANRYLLERGIATDSRAVFPSVVKWLTIGFLGTIGMIMLFIVILVMLFTPLIQVDEDNDNGKGRVKILGGMIDLQPDELSQSVFSGLEGLDVNIDWEDEEDRYRHEGVVSDLKAGATFDVEFSNGKVDIETHPDQRNLIWNCRSKDRRAKEKFEQAYNKEKQKLDLSGFSGIACELSVPTDIQLVIEGANGVIEFEEPHFDVDARLSNGKIEFEPAADKKYAYHTRLNIGKITGFPESADQPDYSIALRLNNGVIRYDR
ncbi:MAG: DUF1700 domain-containing protein [Bdellovibrionota bacterium]